jgi:hypothetical protein
MVNAELNELTVFQPAAGVVTQRSRRRHGVKGGSLRLRLRPLSPERTNESAEEVEIEIEIEREEE